MHISEGILNAPLIVGGAALAAVGTVAGLRAIDPERIMTPALLAATFFVASLLHVPLGPGSVHLLLNGLMGLLLGWGCVPVIAVALLLQAIFFQFGGFTALGANIVIIAGPALLCGLLARPHLARPGRRMEIAAFAAGAGAIALSGLLLALVLISTDEQFLLTARLVLLAHLPVMLIEGLITMVVVRFLARVEPEMLGQR
ncbi:MAG: cobalt transporter CbiM [Thermodesulfobacteriota bacterium]